MGMDDEVIYGRARMHLYVPNMHSRLPSPLYENLLHPSLRRLPCPRSASIPSPPTLNMRLSFRARSKSNKLPRRAPSPSSSRRFPRSIHSSRRPRPEYSRILLRRVKSVP